MENTSKALIMAGSVLIGMLIVSIAVYLFNVFASQSKETYNVMEQTVLVKFNNQFLNFSDKKCTIHDIVNLANLAQQNNLKNKFIIPITPTPTNINDPKYTYEPQIATSLQLIDSDTDRNNITHSYVRIDLNNKHLELYSTEYMMNLIKENALKTDGTNETKFYECEEFEMSEATGKVCYMKFKEST